MRNIRREVMALLGVSLLPGVSFAQGTPGAKPAAKPVINPPPTAKDWADIAKLPDERYGLVMVFRTFDRASFALVMQASRPVAVSDFVTNP